jgi:hypothetical protein
MKSFYFEIHFDVELAESILPESFTNSNLFSISFASHMFHKEDDVVESCNENIMILMEHVIKHNPDFIVKKIERTNHEEFDEFEICKILIINKNVEATDLSDLLDETPISFSIYAGDF